MYICSCSQFDLFAVAFLIFLILAKILEPFCKIVQAWYRVEKLAEAYTNNFVIGMS